VEDAEFYSKASPFSDVIESQKVWDVVNMQFSLRNLMPVWKHRMQELFMANAQIVEVKE